MGSEPDEKLDRTSELISRVKSLPESERNTIVAALLRRCNLTESQQRLEIRDNHNAFAGALLHPSALPSRWGVKLDVDDSMPKESPAITALAGELIEAFSGDPTKAVGTILRSCQFTKSSWRLPIIDETGTRSVLLHASAIPVIEDEEELKIRGEIKQRFAGLNGDPEAYRKLDWIAEREE